MILLLLISSGFAQNFTLKNSKTINNTSDSVVGFFNNEKTDEVVRIYSNFIGYEKIQNGDFSGMYIARNTTGLIFQDGTKYQLSNNENIIEFVNHRLLTVKHDYNNYTKQLSVYQVDKNSLSSQQKIEIKEIEGGVILLENGGIVVTDFSEGYGEEIKIYTPKLDLVKSYRPYSFGISNCKIASHGKSIYAIFTPSDNSGIHKIVNIDAESGELLMEKSFPQSDQDCSLILASSKYAVTYWSGSLIVFDHDGKQLWNKEVVLPYFNVDIANDELLYYVDSNYIFCDDLRNGNTVWRKSIYEISSSSNLNRKNFEIKVSDNEKILYVIVSKASKRDDILKKELVVIDEKGNLKSRIESQEGDEIIGFLRTNRGFKLINNHSVKSYEK